MKFMLVEIFLIKKKNVICSEKSTLGKMYKAKDFVFLHVKFTKLHVCLMHWSPNLHHVFKSIELSEAHACSSLLS